MSEQDAWERRYRRRGRAVRQPARFVTETVPRLGPPGTAVDLAGGTGRNAIWLAKQGWDVTLVDVSPTALQLAAGDAAVAGVDLRCHHVDLEVVDPPGGPWELVVVHHYLNRRLLAGVDELLEPGGHLVMAHPTVRNLERNDRPGPRFLLEEGELPSLVAAGMLVVSFVEGWTTEDRHEARLVASRPS